VGAKSKNYLNNLFKKTNIMKNLESYKVLELNKKEKQEIDGGTDPIVPVVIIGGVTAAVLIGAMSVISTK